MHAATLFSAFVAMGSSLAAAASTCTKDIEISQATPSIDCETVDAKITVKGDVSGDLVIDGPKKIKGDLVITNVTNLLSVSSDTIESIEGTLRLESLELLGSVKMGSLKQINEITLITLNQLNGITFGKSGVTSAKSIIVRDTFLSDLSGLNAAEVDTLDISNNRRLTMFNSDLVNCSTLISIASNGDDMMVNMTKLESAAEIQLTSVKSFDVPLLQTVSKSFKYNNSTELEKFEAKNLTEVGQSVTFNNNENLEKISFPLLTKIRGDITIQNNTAMETITGFPELETVYGALSFRGNFSDVKLPKLEDVKGSTNIISTANIDDACSELKDGGKIQGESNCRGRDPNANDANSDGSGSSSDSDDDEGAAGIVGVNTAVLAFGLFAGLLQLL